MRLTIHIGPHKTGTTALQSAFTNGARVLRNHDVLYPRCNWMHPAQHRLAFALKQRRIPGIGEIPNRDAEIDAFQKALDRCPSDHVFLSSEEFFATPPEALAEFRVILNVDTVDILTFLRRPDRFLVSCYNQKMRQPGNGFKAPMHRFLKDPRQIAPEINYLEHMEGWAEVFGDTAINIKTYETAPPLKQTLMYLGLPSDLLPDIPRVNHSVPGAVIEVIRHAKLADMSKKQQRKVLDHAIKVFADKPPYALSNDDRANVIGHFESDNDTLFSRFGLTNPYTVENFLPEPDIPPANLNIGDMMRLVETLL